MFIHMQAAVISAVVDQVQAALLQEATLCWSLLLAAGQPLSLAEVSRAAGQLLSDACGYPVRTGHSKDSATLCHTAYMCCSGVAWH
jgi:hypothetical protein